MKFGKDLIPSGIFAQYNLAPLIHIIQNFIEICKGIYGFPEAGIVANTDMQKDLVPN